MTDRPHRRELTEREVTLRLRELESAPRPPTLRERQLLRVLRACGEKFKRDRIRVENLGRENGGAE